MINHMWSKFVLLLGLWNIYLKQWNYKKSIKFYKKALSKKSNNIKIIEILSDLYFDTKQYDKSLRYTIKFLKENPRNPEKLGIKWYCLEQYWKRKEAIIEYNKILDIQPYNSEITERIKKLKKKLKN
jgi:tetratricopeptide (TPR) repeat protein